MSVCAQTPFTCNRHTQHWQTDCAGCVAAVTLNSLAESLVKPTGQIRTTRDTIGVLEARIADLEDDLVALRRRVTELEHSRIAAQAAQNKLAAEEPTQP